MFTLNHSIATEPCVAGFRTNDLAVTTRSHAGLGRFVTALLSALSALSV